MLKERRAGALVGAVRGIFILGTCYGSSFFILEKKKNRSEKKKKKTFPKKKKNIAQKKKKKKRAESFLHGSFFGWVVPRTGPRLGKKMKKKAKKLLFSGRIV